MASISKKQRNTKIIILIITVFILLILSELDPIKNRTHYNFEESYMQKSVLEVQKKISLSSGCNDFIAKPFKSKTFLSILTKKEGIGL